jgi:hypothetical protein
LGKKEKKRENPKKKGKKQKKIWGKKYRKSYSTFPIYFRVLINKKHTKK